MIPGDATNIRRIAIIADFIGIKQSKYSHFIGFLLHKYAIRNGGNKNVAVVCMNWNHFNDATDVLSGISIHRANATIVNRAIQHSHCMDLTKTDESVYFPRSVIFFLLVFQIQKMKVMHLHSLFVIVLSG